MLTKHSHTSPGKPPSFLAHSFVKDPVYLLVVPLVQLVNKRGLFLVLYLKTKVISSRTHNHDGFYFA